MKRAKPKPPTKHEGPKCLYAGFPYMSCRGMVVPAITHRARLPDGPEQITGSMLVARKSYAVEYLCLHHAGVQIASTVHLPQGIVAKLPEKLLPETL